MLSAIGEDPGFSLVGVLAVDPSVRE